MANADVPLIDGRTYHLTTEPDVFPPHCVLTGSPRRSDMIAAMLENAVRVDLPDHREYRCYVGKWQGHPVGVVTHHMGSGSMGTILPEVYASGGRRLIRVGSCSSFRDGARPGDISIIESEIRWDGASDEMIDPRVPAVSDRAVVSKLEDAAIDHGGRYHIGMGATSITFHHGQGRPDFDGYVSPQMQARLDLLRRLQVVSFQMETATLLAWATSMGGRRRGIYVGAVHANYANRFRPDDELVEGLGDDYACWVALEALRKLANDLPNQT